MTDIFQGQLMNRTQCLSCGYTAFAFDNFMDLSVEIPQKAEKFTSTVKIYECFDKFVAPEQIQNAGLRCDGCRQAVHVSKELSIYRFPRILVIHLKRFYQSAMRREKLNTPV
jgi:ubiquitin C-terminal hydrolase